ncbi:MAG TPA: YtxH domain-containing protein [Terriglobales bacterium]|nr:YtxH domain-containing protein [Terriglobales bacterium]
MNLNKFVKVALKTGLYLLEQSDKATAEMRERLSNQVEDVIDRTREVISPKDHTLRNVLSLAAGVGVGVAIGMLFAPAKGEELRNSIAGTVQDAGAKFRQRFSAEERAATGTTG